MSAFYLGPGDAVGSRLFNHFGWTTWDDVSWYGFELAIAQGLCPNIIVSFQAVLSGRQAPVPCEADMLCPLWCLPARIRYNKKMSPQERLLLKLSQRPHTHGCNFPRPALTAGADRKNIFPFRRAADLTATGLPRHTNR